MPEIFLQAAVSLIPKVNQIGTVSTVHNMNSDNLGFIGDRE
jgi:hypothetical protein